MPDAGKGGERRGGQRLGRNRTVLVALGIHGGEVGQAGAASQTLA